MSDLVERLLQPVSPEQVCGPDLSYDARFNEIETLLAGTPEVEIGDFKKPAEPPDWRALKGKCVEFLGASKHLRVAVILCGALLREEGLAGFRDGLKLVRGLVEQFWPNVFPLLDPDDNNDPTQRLNLLAALSPPKDSYATMQSWLRIGEFLQSAPLARPKGRPPVILTEIVAAREHKSGATDLAQLQAALRNAPADELQANHAALDACLDTVTGLDAFLTSTLGAGRTINFEELQRTLKEMRDALGSFVPGGASPDAADGGAASAGAPVTTGAAAGVEVPGLIRSREDVVRTLENLCAYYERTEPASPIPYLLRRAQKMAQMNFVELMQELALASPDQLKPSLGSGLPDSSASPPPQG